MVHEVSLRLHKVSGVQEECQNPLDHYCAQLKYYSMVTGVKASRHGLSESAWLDENPNTHSISLKQARGPNTKIASLRKKYALSIEYVDP